MTGTGDTARQPISIVEIDQDFCELRYGTTNGAGTCPAVLGVDSTIKCFNTLASCPVPDSFTLGDGSPSTEGKLTLRFCTPAENLPRDVTLLPYVTDLTSTPTELNIGVGDLSVSPLGTRATVTVTLSDHPYHDRIVDPYAAERTYDAMELGTFWSKWLRRNPYYQGRALRVRDGYIGQALVDMRVRHYVIDRIEGPSEGKIKITAKDPIKSLDQLRAQAPAPTGATLATLIARAAETDTPDTFVNLPVSLLPAGIGDDLADDGAVRIGSELFLYVNLGSDDLLLTKRMQRHTRSSEHKIGDAVQDVAIFSGSANEVIYELAVTYGGFNPAFIDTAEWEEEALLWSPSLMVEAWITEPTGVDKLIGEIVQQAGCYIWWDLLAQKLNFKVLRPRIAGIDDEPEAVNDAATFIASQIKIEDKPDERITRVNIYFDQIDPTQGNQASNFAQTKSRADEDAESAVQYGEARIKEIFARWLGPGAGGAAHGLAVRLVKRYRDTPKLITFSVDAKDRDIATADFLSLTHHALVDLTGAAEARVVQITSVDDVEPGHRSELQARISENDTEGYAIIVDDSAPDYLAATDEEKAFGCWIADASGELSNGDPGYRII